MQIYDWLLLVLGAGGFYLGVSALLTGLRGLARRKYGGATMFLILGICFSVAGLYTAYLAAWGTPPGV